MTAVPTPSPAPNARARVTGSSALRPDGKRDMIAPADVRGRFITRRRLTFAALLAIYLALPLVQVGGHPALHLDVGARRFYILGGSFDPQDFWRVLFLLTAVGAGLLFMTAWLGRAWCGWACPQTVFLEGLYRPVERLIEGPRERRLKLRGTPWTGPRLLRAIAKHAAFIAISLALSHVALSLFLSARELAGMIREGPSQHVAAFAWAISVTVLLYGNFAWFREQLCLVICPYGRLQSAMVDRDSKIVGYDIARGEPRGRLIKNAKPPAPDRGDCVDCMRCVQVCPTGIDIRNGLQMECIACAQCIDACDEVMTRVGRPQGLIRYDSLRGLSGEKRRTLRPRLIGYAVVFAGSAVALVASLWTRASFEVTALRAPGVPFVLDAGQVRNQYELHVVNKLSGANEVQIQTHTDGVQVIVPTPVLELGSLESVRVPVFVSEPVDGARQNEIELQLEDRTGERHEVELRFLAPPRQP